MPFQRLTAERPGYNHTLQWTGPASSVLVNSKSVGAVPAIERWSVMQQGRAPFPFSDLHSFKDYVGFVKLCAPDRFPQREGVSDADQWTLDLAYEGLQKGLRIAAEEGVKESVLSECRSLTEKAFTFYRADNLHDGFRAMEAAERILRRVPSR